METRDYYVYCWKRDSDNNIFYIGFGKNNRYKSLRQRNKQFLEFIDTYKCHPEITQENLTDEEAKILEKELIYRYWEIGQAETNLHAGGSGGDTLKYMTPDELVNFKNKISQDSKSKWQKEEVRERIVNSISKAMKDENVKNKISVRTKEGMRAPESWDKFIKNRAKTTVIVFQDGSTKTFESKSSANRFLKSVYGSKFPFFKESKNIYVSQKSPYYPLIGLTIKIIDKYNNECVTTICDECSRVG